MMKRPSRVVVPKGYVDGLLTDEEYMEVKQKKRKVKKKKKRKNFQIEYVDVEFEASFMPNAGDFGLLERYMITHRPSEYLIDDICADNFGRTILTKPVIQDEATFARFAQIFRHQRDIDLEMKHRKKHQGWMARLRGRPVPPVSRFEWVRLEKDARIYHKFVMALHGRVFEKLDADDILRRSLERYKVDPEILVSLVEERINPVAIAHIPHQGWWIGFLLIECASLGAIFGLVFGVFQYDPALLGSFHVLTWILTCGTFWLVLTISVLVWKRAKKYIRARWKTSISKVQDEIDAVNADLAKLEGANPQGKVKFLVNIHRAGVDPYFEPDAFRNFLPMIEEERKIQKEMEVFRNAKTGDMVSDERARETLSELKSLNRKRAKISRQVHKYSKRMQVIHSLSLHVEFPQYARDVPTGEIMDAGEGHKSPTTRADITSNVCRRCQDIQEFARTVGLDSLSGDLCKSAQNDYLSFQELLKQKLAKANGHGKQELQNEEEEVKASTPVVTAEHVDTSKLCVVCHAELSK